MGPASRTLKRDVLHVAIVDGTGKEMWRKDIPVMLIPDPPQWPTFGAVDPSSVTMRRSRLREDSRSTTRTVGTRSSTMSWCSFPNGARFVFWRGSSYCPFWAGRSNTGFSYEWAEISGQHMVGARDCVEPLQDKELRYGRVEIVESTPARVHVRWSYQSCDLDYKVWGDFATEDYYFYPDGFGTRVMTLTAVPGLSFTETNEFISFSPQSGYPFEYVPANLVDILWPQGKAEFRFPCVGQEEQWAKLNARPKDATLLYRIRLRQVRPRWPRSTTAPTAAPDLPGFAPFYDRGRDGHADVLGMPLAAKPGIPDGQHHQRPHSRDTREQLLDTRRHAQADPQRDRHDGRCPGTHEDHAARTPGFGSSG